MLSLTFKIYKQNKKKEKTLTPAAGNRVTIKSVPTSTYSTMIFSLTYCILSTIGLA